MTRENLRELLVSYTLGELNTEMSQAMSRLIATDAELAGEAETLAATVALLADTLGDSPAPEGLSDKRKRRILAAGATAPSEAARRKRAWTWLVTPQKGIGVIAAAALLLIVVTLAGLLMPAVQCSRERADATRAKLGGAVEELGGDYGRPATDDSCYIAPAEATTAEGECDELVEFSRVRTALPRPHFKGTPGKLKTGLPAPADSQKPEDSGPPPMPPILAPEEEPPCQPAAPDSPGPGSGRHARGNGKESVRRPDRVVAAKPSGRPFTLHGATVNGPAPGTKDSDGDGSVDWRYADNGRDGGGRLDESFKGGSELVTKFHRVPNAALDRVSGFGTVAKDGTDDDFITIGGGALALGELRTADRDKREKADEAAASGKGNQSARGTGSRGQLQQPEMASRPTLTTTPPFGIPPVVTEAERPFAPDPRPDKGERKSKQRESRKGDGVPADEEPGELVRWNERSSASNGDVLRADAPASDLHVRTYEVDPDVAKKVQERPVAEGTGNAWESAFKGIGVDWPRGAQIRYVAENGQLVVKNTRENLADFDAAFTSFVADAKRPDTRFRAYGVNPVYATVDRPFSTFSIDVDTASYALTRGYMAQGFLPPAEAVRTEEFVNSFDYGYKAPLHRTFKVFAGCAPTRFGRGLHLLKIGVKGRRLGREEQRRAILTFLIDTSGSMDKPDRIELVQRSLRMLLSKLALQDEVAIVQYSSHARVVIEHTSVNDRGKLLAAVDALQCGGSTNLEEGMRRAYALAASAFVAGCENRVLLLSDGVANLGTGSAGDILAQVERYRKQGITCSVFGFGMGTYDDEMLETLANKGDGNYTFVDSDEQARRVFVDDLAATLNTIASDVKIQVEFNPKRVRRYRQLGYENRQLAKEDFRNDAVDAGEIGSGQSVTALYEVELSGRSREPLGTVRVRYRRVDTGAVEEIAHAIRPSDVAKRFVDAEARFKLAMCVAEFAELLRGSPYAAGNDYANVAALLRPAALELDLDQNVQELLRLVQGAGSMSRGE